MKKALAILKRAYVAGAAWAVALAALLGAILFATGTITWSGVEDAVAALRKRRPPPPARGVPREKDATEEEIRLKSAREAFEREKEMRDAELKRLDDRVTLRLAELEKERKGIEEKRREHEAQLEAVRKGIQSAEAAKFAQELEANLPILMRMDGATVLALMKGWDDARIVRYLRSMRPAKAAEVLEAMNADALFEQDFRLPPPGTPPGTPTRAQRLMEAFAKAP